MRHFLMFKVIRPRGERQNAGTNTHLRPQQFPLWSALGRILLRQPRRINPTTGRYLRVFTPRRAATRPTLKDAAATARRRCCFRPNLPRGKRQSTGTRNDVGAAPFAVAVPAISVTAGLMAFLASLILASNCSRPSSAALRNLPRGERQSAGTSTLRGRLVVVQPSADAPTILPRGERRLVCTSKLRRRRGAVSLFPRFESTPRRTANLGATHATGVRDADFCCGCPPCSGTDFSTQGIRRIPHPRVPAGQHLGEAFEGSRRYKLLTSSSVFNRRHAEPPTCAGECYTVTPDSTPPRGAPSEHDAPSAPSDDFPRFLPPEANAWLDSSKPP
uniref:Uncharacterized protein n=1 Tax=Mycena chlorophos TaxID=658473 RepID=A0ABQ0KZE6_MYCCL|nr:predicted protein [Mycena chlorophos]